MRIHLTLILLLSLTIQSCRKKEKEAKEELLYVNNFDSHFGFVNDYFVLDEIKAHSGRYYTQIDQFHEYSIGFNAKLDQITKKPVKKIIAEAYFLMNDKSPNATLVVSVEKNGQHYAWGGTDLALAIQKPGEWIKVSADVVLPKLKDNDYMVKIYLWNRNKGLVYIDDLSVKFETRE